MKNSSIRKISLLSLILCSGGALTATVCKSQFLSNNSASFNSVAKVNLYADVSSTSPTPPTTSSGDAASEEKSPDGGLAISNPNKSI